MLQNILTITGAEIKSAENCDNSGIKIKDAAFINRLLAFFFNNPINFVFSFSYHFLDFGGLNPAVKDKVFKRKSCHLPADWVKRRDNDRAGRVINNKLNAGDPLKSPDI